MAIITIFGCGNCDSSTVDYENAYKLGNALGKMNIGVATGGYGGIMDAISKGASEYDVPIIGVTTEVIENKSANIYIKKEIKTKTYLERTEKLIEFGDSYVIFPGNAGTLLEFAAVWALKEKGLLGEKAIIAIGEQWHEIKQNMAFFSETVIDSYDLVSSVNDWELAVKLIVAHLKKIGKY